MESEKIIDARVYDFSKKMDVIQTVLIYLIAFLVPTFLGELLKNIFPATSIVATKSQIIVGSIVNATLIITALNLKSWTKILGVITMPSISTMLSGYVFSTASVYMVYMIPAIWIGNFALVYAYKYLKAFKKQNYFLAGIIGIVVKVAVIFGFFSLLNAFHIFPEKMVTNLQAAMSTTQAITAIIGTLVAFVIYKVEIKKENN